MSAVTHTREMQAQQQRAAVQEESIEDESLGPQLVSRLEVVTVCKNC